jgi:hypothetical protein
MILEGPLCGIADFRASRDWELRMKGPFNGIADFRGSRYWGIDTEGSFKWNSRF